MSRYKRLKKRLNIKVNKKQHQPGLPPGALVYLGEEQASEIKLKQIEYSEDFFRSREITLDTLFKTQDDKTKDWIIISGIHKPEVIREIGQIFKVNLLDLEDILTPDHPPKIEIYDDYIFITLKYLDAEKYNEEIKPEQISIIFGKNFLLMFRESGNQDFKLITERIAANNHNRFVKENTDYLCYSILDYIIDNYFVILDKIDDEIQEIDAKFDNDYQTGNVLEEIRRLKRETIILKKYFKPMREIVRRLREDSDGMISEETRYVLRDLYDHSIEVYESEESMRDHLNVLMDVYMSVSDFKMNQIIKVLTIISTIFLPLTFIAGVYGMNFKFMPELGWKLGYPFALTIMAAVAIVMIIYFRVKKWI